VENKKKSAILNRKGEFMKMRVILFTMFAALLTLTIGCSKGSMEDAETKSFARNQNIAYGRAVAYASDAINEAAVLHDEIRAEESGETQAANLNNTERKLIKRAYVRVRVENLDEADAVVTGLLEKYEAYSASTEADENSRHYSLRVPSYRYDDFLAEMNGMGRLLRRSESTEDVTLRYYDLEGRLETKRELLRTFQSYLTRARNIEEILSVEARIAELQSDIEGTGAQLRHLSNKVDYSTIDLNLAGPITSGQNKGFTLGEQIKQLFGGFGKFLSGVAVAIIGIIIYGIPVLLLIALLFWLFFGRVGLMRRLWVLVKGKKQG